MLVVLWIDTIEVNTLGCQPGVGVGSIPHIIKVGLLYVVEHFLIVGK